MDTLELSVSLAPDSVVIQTALVPAKRAAGAEVFIEVASRDTWESYGTWLTLDELRDMHAWISSFLEKADA